MKFWRMAAHQCVVPAQGMIGHMYYLGAGVTKDNVQAYKWLSLADSLGDESAAEIRDIVSREMTSAQIAKAEKLAREWKPE